MVRPAALECVSVAVIGGDADHAACKFPVLTSLIGSYLVRYHYLVWNLHMDPKRWSGGAGIEASVDSR